jgi:hypothetical protein
MALAVTLELLCVLLWPPFELCLAAPQTCVSPSPGAPPASPQCGTAEPLTISRGCLLPRLILPQHASPYCPIYDPQETPVSGLSPPQHYCWWSPYINRSHLK